MADYLIRGVAWDERVRVVAAVASDTVEELRRIHEPSAPTTAAIGRVAVGALLLAGSLEKVTSREPLLTVEVEGDGPAGRLVATASPAGWVRAMVANPAATAEPVINGKLNVAGVVGRHGELSVTRDPGFGEPYRGVVPLASGEIAQDLVHYLHDSEQTPAAVLLGVFVTADGRVGSAGGLIVELLPGVSDDEAETLTRRIRTLGAVTSRLNVGQGPEDWLGALFPEDHAIIDRLPVRFLCGCSVERVEGALKLLGAAEMREMIAANPAGPTRLTCEFCRREYEVSTAEMHRLLAEVEAETAAPDVN